MANTTNFGWETPDDTDLVKDGAAAMRTLGNAIDASFVDLKGGTTGQILSKASNTDLDYTWITNDVGDITEVVAGTGLSGGGSSGSVTLTNTVATTYDAKGDLVVGTGADTFAKLTIGANDTLLIADSAETTGARWGGGWTTWTPSYTNFTVGNGTAVARYQQVGKTVNFEYKFTFGSTSSFGASPRFTLPATPKTDGYGAAICYITDSGTAEYVGGYIINGTTLYPYVIGTGASFAGRSDFSSTNPFTWTTNDFFVIHGSFEVA